LSLMTHLEPTPGPITKDNHILAKLDRILASVEWDGKYPTSQVTMLLKGVSDHHPMRITFVVKKQI
jgi:hypothetical protein